MDLQKLQELLSLAGKYGPDLILFVESVVSILNGKSSTVEPTEHGVDLHTMAWDVAQTLKDKHDCCEKTTDGAK